MKGCSISFNYITVSKTALLLHNLKPDNALEKNKDQGRGTQ